MSKKSKKLRTQKKLRVSQILRLFSENGIRAFPLHAETMEYKPKKNMIKVWNADETCSKKIFLDEVNNMTEFLYAASRTRKLLSTKNRVPSDTEYLAILRSANLSANFKIGKNTPLKAGQIMVKSTGTSKEKKVSFRRTSIMRVEMDKLGLDKIESYGMEYKKKGNNNNKSVIYIRHPECSPATNGKIGTALVKGDFKLSLKDFIIASSLVRDKIVYNRKIMTVAEARDYIEKSFSPKTGKIIKASKKIKTIPMVEIPSKESHPVEDNIKLIPAAEERLIQMSGLVMSPFGFKYSSVGNEIKLEVDVPIDGGQSITNYIVLSIKDLDGVQLVHRQKKLFEIGSIIRERILLNSSAVAQSDITLLEEFFVDIV